MRFQATPNSLALLVATLVAFCPAPVVGSTSQSSPCEGACYESFPEPCERAVVLYDFGGVCCFALTDSEDGGCDVTVSANAADDGDSVDCSYETRLTQCEAGDTAFPTNVACVGNHVHSWTIVNGKEDCPPSDYEISTDSDSGDVFPLKITLTGGASSWTEDDTDAWKESTQDFFASFYEENPLVGIRDVITTIDLYDDDTVVDDMEDTVSLVYLQQITWRTDLPNITATAIIGDAMNSEKGEEGYLLALQASNSSALSAVTAVSPVEILEEVEADDPPGGAGGASTQTHETDTLAPTTSPQEEPIGVTVTATGGEDLPDEPTQAPEKETTTAPESGGVHSTAIGFLAAGMALVVSSL